MGFDIYQTLSGLGWKPVVLFGDSSVNLLMAFANHTVLFTKQRWRFLSVFAINMIVDVAFSRLVADALDWSKVCDDCVSTEGSQVSNPSVLIFSDELMNMCIVLSPVTTGHCLTVPCKHLASVGITNRLLLSGV